MAEPLFVSSLFLAGKVNEVILQASMFHWLLTSIVGVEKSAVEWTAVSFHLSFSSAFLFWFLPLAAFSYNVSRFSCFSFDNNASLISFFPCSRKVPGIIFGSTDTPPPPHPPFFLELLCEAHQGSPLSRWSRCLSVLSHISLNSLKCSSLNFHLHIKFLIGAYFTSRSYIWSP